MTLSQPQTLADAWQHRRAGRFDTAFEVATALVADDASNVGALRLLGALTIQNGDPQAGVALAQRAIDIAGPSPDLLAELGQGQLHADDPASALASFRQVLEQRPKDPTALLGLAQAHHLLGQAADAVRGFEAALAVLPYDKYARHMLAALSGAGGRASTAYIADLFDSYAETFDEHLTGRLHYRTPQLLADMIRPHPASSLLDLGCGTGLVGAALHRDIAILDGVDLATQMVAKARERGLYRHLRIGDLLATLISDADFAGPYDVVVAADVLVYIGDLEATFAAVAARQSPRGLFALSIEVSDSAAILLQTSGRYAHSPAYIATLAARNGYIIIEQRAAPIRLERSQPIPGMLFLLRAQ